MVNEIANSKEYLNLCRVICKGDQLYKDLFQELILILCEYDQNKLKEINERGQLKWFIIRILQNQFNSATSPFYKKYRKLNEVFDIPEIEHDNRIDILDNELIKDRKFTTSADWYEWNILKLYLQEGSIRGVEKKTKISRVALSETLKKVKDKLKTEIESKINDID